MIYDKQPDNFNPRMEVSGCFLEGVDKKFLILLREDHKPQGNTWGIPGGKVNKDEKLEDSILREIEEETGNKFRLEDINFFKKLYVRYKEYDFIYYIFSIKLKSEIDIVLEKDGHKDFRWVTPEESLEVDYIQDLDVCVKMFYGIK